MAEQPRDFYHSCYAMSEMTCNLLNDMTSNRCRQYEWSRDRVKCRINPIAVMAQDAIVLLQRMIRLCGKDDGTNVLQAYCSLSRLIDVIHGSESKSRRRSCLCSLPDEESWSSASVVQ